MNVADRVDVRDLSSDLTAATYLKVETQASCLITRFRLTSIWSLLPFYLAFRRVRAESAKVPGLVKATFLVESLRVCYTLSIWQNEAAVMDFSSTIRSHIGAANTAIGRTWNRDKRRAEIWSAQFRLWAVSCHSLNWDECDLTALLSEEQLRRRAAVIERFHRGSNDAH